MVLPVRKPRSQEEFFVWRRAFRAGKVSRGDLIAAFNCAETKATNILKSVLVDSGGLLTRKRRYVVPAPWARSRPPDWAGEDDLLQQLERQLHNPEHTSSGSYHNSAASPYTGLRTDELPVIYHDWSRLRAGSEGSLWAICQAIRDNQSVWIEYTSLSKHKSRSWRRILPLSLHRTDATWRVYAHDLEVDTYPLRNFKLTRISGHKVDEDKVPKKFTIANPIPPEPIYQVQWNPHLNDDHIEVFSVEFGVVDSKLTISSTSAYEFKLRYEGKSTSSDIAWPPFSTITNKNEVF